MLARMKEKGADPQRTVLFPNWVDTDEIYPLSDEHRNLCGIFGVPVDRVIVLYAGSMGSKQGLELIIEAARRLQASPEIHFVLCGDGAARGELQHAAEGLLNIQFLPLQPAQSLNQRLNLADMHVLPQRADAADLVMPSKLLGMLASGKAVIATAKPGTEVGNVIGKVGVLVPPGACEPLCEAIQTLASAPQVRSEFGQKGREYVRERWGVKSVLSEYQTRLVELVRS